MWRRRPPRSAARREKALWRLRGAGARGERARGREFPSGRHALSSNNKALPDFNGDDSWDLPVPATYVVAPYGRIAFAEVEVDYRMRMEPDTILAALRALQAA